MDIHSGTFDNSPGKIVEMPREEVDSDVNQTCSRGLHACADSYLGEFYAKSSGYKVIVVKINPKDVCAVPADYNFSKMRTCRYEVLSEAEEETVREIAQSEFSTFGQRAYEAAPEAPEVTGPLQVGDRVKLSKHGISQYVSPHWPNPRNPENVVGTLFEDPEPIMGFVWTVDWDNGSSNNYREEDLELVDRPSAGMDDYAESWGGFPDEDYYSSYEPDYYNSYDDYR